MKKTFNYLVLVLLTISLFSCDENVTQNDLLGKWKMVAEHVYTYENGKFVYSDGTKDEEPGVFDTMEFFQDGTYESGYWGKGTYILNENGKTITLKSNSCDLYIADNAEDEKDWYVILEVTKTSNNEFELSKVLDSDFYGFEVADEEITKFIWIYSK